MLFRNAYAQLNRNWTIILYPIVLDIFALWAGWKLGGFSGEQKWSLKWLLDMGLPSLSHLSNIPLFANTMDFLRIFGQEGSAVSTVVIFILLLVLCFVQGGYITGLHTIASDNKPNLAQFFRNGKAFFIHFLLYNMMVYLLKIGVTLGLTAFLGSAGLFLSLLVFIALRIVFIYLEFTMVVDRLSWDQVLGQSRVYFKSSLSLTSATILVMYVSSGLLSLLLHRLWSIEAVIVGVIVSAYVMTGIQLAFMMILSQTKARL